ncbi:hypothetical protein JTB14_019443 [Gonioctena quinquepunctata]|nr:hypothetical protein JTB14_019443 [Gonioctena quinquepunctata]
MLLNFVNIVYILSISSTLLRLSENSALSIFELKKYKRITDAQGLYSSKDDVEILTIDNFKDEIYGNERAFVVEFYNSWCGFCQRFAPSWKALASDVKGWRSLVGIGAVDCSNDENNPLCREFEIMAYPTIKYFHEDYKEGPKNFGEQILLGKEDGEHRQKIIEIMQKEQNENRGKIFPNLLPFTESKLKSLFNGASEKVKYALLFIQNPSDFIGQEIALDLNKIKEVVVRYTFDNNTELMRVLEATATSIPALFFVNRDGTFHILNSSPTRQAFSTAIYQIFNSKHIMVPKGVTDKHTNIGKWMDSKVPDMKEFMQERERSTEGKN